MSDERKVEIWGDGKADVIEVTFNGKPAEIKKGEPTTAKVPPKLEGNGPWLIVVTMPDGERAIRYEWKETRYTSACSKIADCSPVVVLGGTDTTTGLSTGLAVSGTGIPANTVIKTITDPTHLTLSKPAEATNTDTELTFRTDPIEIKKKSDADEDDVKSMIKAVDEAAESIVSGFETSLDASIDKAAKKIAEAAEKIVAAISGRGVETPQKVETDQEGS